MNKQLVVEVIRGKGEGRKLGFPTANMVLRGEVTRGVYGGKVYFEGKEYKAGIFVHDQETILEAHLLDFSGDLYGKILKVETGEKLRDPIRFKNMEETRSRITSDIEIIKKLLADN